MELYMYTDGRVPVVLFRFLLPRPTILDSATASGASESLAIASSSSWSLVRRVCRDWRLVGGLRLGSIAGPDLIALVGCVASAGVDLASEAATFRNLLTNAAIIDPVGDAGETKCVPGR